MLAVLVLTGAPVLSIVAVAIVASCVSTFFGPAIGAYLPSLVDDEADLGPANSVWATLDNLAYFVGPAIAGIVIADGWPRHRIPAQRGDVRVRRRSCSRPFRAAGR